MYFVLSKRPEYTLFCMSPSERFAVGLTEGMVVHLLARGAGADWQVLKQWGAADYSHTALMVALRDRPEPENAAQLIELLPPHLR